MLGCEAVNHLQGADAALHACCKHPAPLRASRMAPYLPGPHLGRGDCCAHTRAIQMHTRTPLLPPALHHPDGTLAPLHPSLSLHRRRAQAFAPCQWGRCQPSPAAPAKSCEDPSRPRGTHPGGCAAGLGTPLPAHGPPAPIGDSSCHVLLKSIQGHALSQPPSLSEQVPSTSPPSKGQSCFPSAAEDGGGRAPAPPRAPRLPRPTSSLGAKVGSWFSAPQRQMEPGMLMLAQLEKHAAQEVAQMPWGWVPGESRSQPYAGIP